VTGVQTCALPILLDEEKRSAIEYMIRVKQALEDKGAIVLLVREGGKEQL
jgi:hypothetical protein